MAKMWMNNFIYILISNGQSQAKIVEKFHKFALIFATFLAPPSGEFPYFAHSCKVVSLSENAENSIIIDQ